MASKFAITAELNLQTKNLSQVVNNLKRQFQGIDLNIKIKDLASAESQVRGIGKAADGASKSMGSLGSSIADAAKRFSAITLATGTFVGLTRAVKNAVGSAIEFEREMVKIAQATGKTVSQLRGLELEVGNIATGLGASSKELINAARTLTQAGFAADKVTGSLKILAQTDLAATFKSIEDTTEGAIAILNQFGREAQNTGNEVAFLERSLSAINQVSKDFAVESSDLITAVKTTGSAFESAGGSLNELIALFTSVRSTTRESAESIATGFRTIFTRVQRVDTMNNLRDLGIELQDVKGQFVGPMEAAKRLSIALSSIDPKDFRFNLIVEQLGGFRQVSKVIPLIQQFSVAQKALSVAQNSSGSLAKDAATAQQSLAVQIQRTREEFLRFVKELTQSTAFQSTVSSLLQMANAFIKVADTLKPMIPLIASFGALKIGQSLLPGIKSIGGNKKAQGGQIHAFASGGLVPGSGNGDTVPAMLSPGEFVIKKSSVKKLGIGNLARANKYAKGGKIEDQTEVGAAILEPGVSLDTSTHKINDQTKSYLKENNTPLFEKVKNKKWTVTKEGVSTKTYGKFRDSIEHGLSRGLEAAVEKSEDFTGVSPIKLTAQNERNFLDTINEGAYGNMFEQILTFAKGKGEFDADSDPKRPFDFTDKLPELLSGDFSNLKMPFVDAKASKAAASNVGDKIDRELLYDPSSYVAGKRYQEDALQSALGKETRAGEKAKEQVVEQSARDRSTAFRNKMIKAIGNKESKPIVNGLSLNNPGEATTLVNNILGTKDFGVNKFNIDRSQQAQVLKTIRQWKTNPPKTLAFASGGNVGTDTVPAMLTPGEYVINKKSAQSIGYGSLNRMNKVGKFASGGPVGVQHFAAGGPAFDPQAQKMQASLFSGQYATKITDPKDRQMILKMIEKMIAAGHDAESAMKVMAKDITVFGKNFKASPENIKKYYKISRAGKDEAIAKQSGPTATENAGKLKAELDDIINKGSSVSSGLVILASTVAGVVSQMSGLDKETADYVTALTGTFATINGIGQNLKNMGFAQIASMKSDREHRAAVEADKKALEQHASAVSGTTSTGDEQPSKFASRLNLASKAAEGAIMGYAAAQALSAAKIAATNARADKASESLGRAMEKFAASANNEAEVRNGMIKTLMLSEEAQADYKASTSTEASVGGAAGGGIGAIIGGALGSLGGPAGTAIGVQLGATIGSFAGTFFGTELAKNFDGAKVTAAAKGISGAFTTASKGILDTNKYFEKIEGKDLNDVNQQFSKMNTELAKAQTELSSFDPDILTTGSEQMKAQFNKAADTVRNFENVIGRLAGVKLQKLNVLINDMAKIGENFDIGPVLKAQQEEITKVLNAKYNPDIARATNAGKGELAQGLTQQRDQEIAQAFRATEKQLLEFRLQAFQTQKALVQERNARDAIIGTLIQEKALKNTLQNFKYAIQQASKASNELDAAFSDSVAGLKSSVPDAGIFDLEMPNAADLEPALTALRTIGPIGENLANSLTDLNTVIPNLETGLLSIAKAERTAPGGDIKKLVEDTIQSGFGVSVGSAVGKRLSEIIQDRMSGKGGTVENANPTIQSKGTQEAIIKEFTDYAEAIKSMSKETLQAWAEAEQEQLKILDKINQSENRKLELTNQGVDSYGRMVEAVSKAYGKNVPLAVKNMQRFAKQFNSIGKTAYTSVQTIGKDLKQAKGKLAQGVKDPLEAGKLQNTANRLEQSLKTLANQSDRTGDTLAELEKFKAQREAITSAGTSYAFGSDEQRKSKDDATAALQQVMAAGGDLDAVSSDMRGQIDSLLGELGDAGKGIKKQLTANFFAKRGNMDMANMVMSESSGPEQKLIAELQTIYQEEIAAQKELKDLEIMHGQGMITGLAQVTNQIAGFNDQLKARVQKGEKDAQDIQKAAGITDSKMTVKEIDEIINSTKTSLTKVEDNIATFAKYLSELNDYLAFVKNPEEFKKNNTPIPAKPGAAPVAKAKGGIIYKADGGFTPRGTDTVPAMLTPGEFVIQKSAVDSIGVGNLEAMNNGYADGGLVSYFRRGGRAMNYGRSANNKRQRAIARRDERRAKKAEAREQGQFFNVADSQQQQTNMATASGTVGQLMGNASAPSQGYGLKPGANPADFAPKPAVPFQMAASAAPGTVAPTESEMAASGIEYLKTQLNPEQAKQQAEIDRNVKIQESLHSSSVAAAKKLQDEGPQRSWLGRMEDRVFGQSKADQTLHRKSLMKNLGVSEAELPKGPDKPLDGGMVGQALDAVGNAASSTYNALNSQGSGRYKSDKNTIYRPNGTGPGVKLNQPKKEEPAKRQISDLSKEEAAKMLGRMTGMANGGVVEYHARGGRAGARARAAQRRQNRMQSEQEFPSMAQVGPQNVHRDLAGTPVTRSVMNNPQNFAQARNARTRTAAMRGTPGALSEMAGMGQTINVGAGTEESQVRTAYSKSGANQFAEGKERQAMLKDIADARQRDKDKYSPERMRSLYGNQDSWNQVLNNRPTAKPTPKVTAPVAPASTMGATAPKAKPKYDGYTNREYPKSNKPLTAVEKAMQAVRPGWRSANFANGGAVHLARGGRVGGYSGGGKIRRYQDGGNVDPYAEAGGGGGGEAPQMPDMSGFAKSIESLTAFVGSFDGFTKTMAGLASQLSSVTVTHNVTFGGQVNVGGVSGEGIVNAMKSTIEGWVKDQISKHPDVKKAVESSDQTRKG